MADDARKPELIKPTLRELSREGIGFLYLIWWFAKTRISRALSWATSRVLVGGLVVVFFDIAAHSWTQEVVAALRVNHWVARLIPFLQYAWLLAIAVATDSELKNWEKKKQEVYFVDAVDLLLDKLDKLALGPINPSTAEDKLATFVQDTLAVARSSFKEKRAVQANFARLTGGHLCIRHVDPPNCKYAADFKPTLEEGGSGYAAKNRAIVYFPSIWIRHAIHIAFDRSKRPTEFNPPGIRRALYIPLAKEYETYKSILTVPVIWENPGSYGVLNFDSKGRDAFSELDFKMAGIYGQLLGLAFKRLGITS